MRYFNTVGPVRCDEHYCLPPLDRIDLEDVMTLIDQQKYFVLHAPRQTGKTSTLKALMVHLNHQRRFRCLYVNFEVAQGYRQNVSEGVTVLLREIGEKAALTLGDTTAEAIAAEMIARPAPSLSVFLSRWCRASDQPTVLLIDEIDALVGDLLITVLRQLRAGCLDRPQAFPQSVILCGVRDVRDYRIRSDSTRQIITGGSAFNIKAASLRLGDFSREDTERLLMQHTSETGQRFEPEAMAAIWDLTQGQPWLVNALAYESCFQMREGRDRSRSISVELVFRAKENLIERREVHLDQLADKLLEARVRQVIEALLVGDGMPANVPEDDLQYVVDLGLIRRKPHVAIANPIYREIIPRTLTSVTQDTMVQQAAWYVRADGRLNMDELLSAFQQFFREHSESWVERFNYREAGPQLLMQAFLQRIVNGGGRIEREYGLGRKRTDLLILWPLAGELGAGKPVQRVVIELKLLHGSLEATVAEGLAQTWAYADRCGAEESHLIIFDRTPGKPWENKLFRREERHEGREITVWGM
ncbi:MAG: ATP-binding protein [Caldilineales bacterium]|nr:ATP-binding protein [Caldilineales bacterium]MCW5860121.1 ATP-binding protein [Caldilineales bacterium]